MGKGRYLAPNVVTSLSIAFGLASIESSLSGHYRTAAWWAMFCVLTDKLDGFVARALRATSPFGAQLDSFADFLSFGIAPATLFCAFFRAVPGAGWSEGWCRVAVPLLALVYVFCVAARL